MYRITAAADAVLTGELGVTSSYEIPQFLINGFADSEEAAIAIARGIIDPLHITTVRISAERVPDDIRENDVAALRKALVTVMTVPETRQLIAAYGLLFGLAEAVAMLLGLDLTNLASEKEDE